MENIFELAEHCLFNADIEQKLRLTHHAWHCLQLGQLDLQSHREPKSISHTCFPDRPQLLLPRDMPRRRLNSKAGQVAFFHALTHIEFVAIYLAWDILYRFRGLPESFYIDWLRVADEEAQHFAMLQAHLQRQGSEYGDLPAHRGLWCQAEDTANDLLARLALVPRCMEARGLDVTPAMIEKFKAMNDEESAAILTRIYQDEIGHVERGCHWFQYVAAQRGVDAEQFYKQLLLNYFKGKPKGPFNREVRVSTGFSHQEIDWLESPD